LKRSIIKWKTLKKKQLNEDLLSIEQQINDLFVKSPPQIFEQEDLDLLNSISQRKVDILSIDEATWRLRSWAISVEKGDKNRKQFQKFVSQRCSHNTIWELSDEDGKLISTDTKLKKMYFKHFKARYCFLNSENIDLQLEVLKTVRCFFNDEDNMEIDKPVLIS
jgi:oligoribonuclease NrnB/cAMP/cGMP phosphodiesterase (DHH superfamily)